MVTLLLVAGPRGTGEFTLRSPPSPVNDGCATLTGPAPPARILLARASAAASIRGSSHSPLRSSTRSLPCHDPTAAPSCSALPPPPPPPCRSCRRRPARPT